MKISDTPARECIGYWLLVTPLPQMKINQLCVVSVETTTKTDGRSIVMSILSWLAIGSGKTDKLEAMSHELDGITGQRVIGGDTAAGGDDNVLRFDFDGNLDDSVNREMNQRGLKSRTFGNSLWIWKE